MQNFLLLAVLPTLILVLFVVSALLFKRMNSLNKRIDTLFKLLGTTDGKVNKPLSGFPSFSEVVMKRWLWMKQQEKPKRGVDYV